jgi:hypothetical protein
MLGAEGNQPSTLVRLAIWERSESVLRYVAECGHLYEPENPFWNALISNFPQAPAVKQGVLPHPSRFVAIDGYQGGEGKVLSTEWQRPQRHAAA